MHLYHQSAALLFLVADIGGTSYLAAAFAPSTAPTTVAAATDNVALSLLTLPMKEEEDLTQIGSLTVPSIGCGTIAWSTNKGKQAESESEFTKNKIITHE